MSEASRVYPLVAVAFVPQYTPVRRAGLPALSRRLPPPSLRYGARPSW